MHFLLVNYEYPPIGGGAATATQALGSAFVRQGHRVTVLASGIGERVGRAEEEGMSIVRLDTRRARADRASILDMLRFTMSALRASWLLARAERFDAALVFFSIPCGPIGWMLNAHLGLPYVLSLRGGDVPGFLPEVALQHALLAPLRRRCVRAARALVANSESLARLAREADGREAGVIPNGVDTEFFHPGARAGRAEVRFIFVGRLAMQKRPDLALDAFRRLRQTGGGGAPVRLAMVGDGPLRARLERQARDLGIADDVEWHGWVDRARLGELYRGADCLIHPSAVEGMSNAVLEAMACGLPVIASYGHGNREIVVNRLRGFAFAVNDVGGLYQSMLSMRADAAARQRFGEANRAFVLERHSWAAAAQCYLELLRPGTSEVAGPVVKGASPDSPELRARP